MKEDNQKDNVDFPRHPYTPIIEADAMLNHKTLCSSRDILTNSNIDLAVEKQITSIVENWLESPSKVQPFIDMQRVLESVRRIPPGDKRIKLMNTVVRTLGQPNMLATYLDMLRDSAKRYGTKEQELCKNKLQSARMHSVYGWCGNTILVESFDEPTEGTYKPVPGLEEMLGNSTSAWNLTIHIWQPNLTAKGFIIKDMVEPRCILEPPHSHPFDFVSMLVVGSMHQSIYRQIDCNEEDNLGTKQEEHRKHYYSNTTLEHVDGVWPPHRFRETCRLKTLEHRVTLRSGDSYYMPCNWIHDVEIDRSLADYKPTITLFLSSEYMVKPHVYMASSMADFHKEHPDLKKNAKPISENSWHDKLKAIATYLRGETDTLNLNKIVRHTEEYAFFHV